MESGFKTNCESGESSRGRSTVMAHEERRVRNWHIGRRIKEGVRKCIKRLRKFRGIRIYRNCKGRGSAAVFMQKVGGKHQAESVEGGLM